MPEFVWRSRETGTADESIVLLGVTVHVCKSAPDTSRIFYLNCDGARRIFFWMQSKDAAKDAENVGAINSVVNGEENGASSSGGAGGGASAIEQHAEQLGIDEEQIAILQALAPEERNQIIEQMGLADHPAFADGASAARDGTPLPPSELPGMATPMVTETPAAPPPVRAGSASAATPDLAFGDDMLRNVMAGAAAASSNGANLADILSPEMVTPLLDNEEFVAALLPHLPEGEATITGLRANVNSPQYSQALQALNSALESGDLAASMGQFGVDPAAVAAAGGGVLGLAAAIAAANPPAEEKMDEAAE